MPPKKQTICLVVFVHKYKRIKVYVAVEANARPAQSGQKKGFLCDSSEEDILDTPIVPEILE